MKGLKLNANALVLIPFLKKNQGNQVEAIGFEKKIKESEMNSKE